MFQTWLGRPPEVLEPPQLAEGRKLPLGPARSHSDGVHRNLPDGGVQPISSPERNGYSLSTGQIGRGGLRDPFWGFLEGICN